MSKLDKERQGKANSITMDLEGMLTTIDIGMSDNEEARDYLKFCTLQGVSEIICTLDTDIAIEVMSNFGEDGKEISINIKKEYGY